MGATAGSAPSLLPADEFRANVEAQARLNNMRHGCPLLAVHFDTQVSAEEICGGIGEQ